MKQHISIDNFKIKPIFSRNRSIFGHTYSQKITLLNYNNLPDIPYPPGRSRGFCFFEAAALPVSLSKRKTPLDEGFLGAERWSSGTKRLGQIMLDRRIQRAFGRSRPGDDEIEELRCVILVHDRAIFVSAELGFAISAFEPAFCPKRQQ
ncbi:hypothetical protein ACVNS2_08750 [Paenibacillus caseinilyticus]|uniref:hypothetical protein n=1 Tax=Paenibacillus mucilaginosus TaxID=61624 RepID=UPI0019D40571|nr:hypothetical protein [Paenibacillus mucilaginosus]